MRRRQGWFALLLFIAGIVIALAAWASDSRDDLDKAMCQSANAGNYPLGPTEDCTQTKHTGWLIVGGSLVGLGILGVVIQSSTGAAIDETPRSRQSPTVADELKKAAELHAAGAISDEEFAAVKKKLLSD